MAGRAARCWRKCDLCRKIGATSRYDATFGYSFSDHSRLTLSVVNMFDKQSPADPTHTSYP